MYSLISFTAKLILLTMIVAATSLIIVSQFASDSDFKNGVIQTSVHTDDAFKPIESVHYKKIVSTHPQSNDANDEIAQSTEDKVTTDDTKEHNFTFNKKTYLHNMERPSAHCARNFLDAYNRSTIKPETYTEMDDALGIFKEYEEIREMLDSIPKDIVNGKFVFIEENNVLFPGGTNLLIAFQNDLDTKLLFNMYRAYGSGDAYYCDIRMVELAKTHNADFNKQFLLDRKYYSDPKYGI